MRINKLFSNYGICSRRDTNRLIEEGRVYVNNTLAFQGQWVETTDFITLDNVEIKPLSPIYIAFNKPQGIICSNCEDISSNIKTFLNFPNYIFPIGRLDKDSEGLILLTNDGPLANSLMNSKFEHEKEYYVQVDKDFTDSFLDNLSKGVEILNTITRPCITKRISSDSFSIILTQGLNRQIRRMCKVFRYNVIMLKRYRILNINLKNLPIGSFRYLNAEEISILKTVETNILS